MKKYLSFVLILLVAVAMSIPARAQTTGTTLQMGAHWDDGTAVLGTVTLGQQNTSGPDTSIATRSLSSGWCAVTTPLSANVFYDVILVAADGTQLVKFPVATLLINPVNLRHAVITLVFRKADHSLASANVQVSLNF